jgi:hypothetical protein
VVYFDTASASFTRAADVDVIAELPGGKEANGVVRFNMATGEGVAQPLVAAEALTLL